MNRYVMTIRFTSAAHTSRDLTLIIYTISTCSTLFSVIASLLNNDFAFDVVIRYSFVAKPLKYTRISTSTKQTMWQITPKHACSEMFYKYKC